MKKNAGFTLVEIIVCVVILSIGLLGLMGLQATALKNSAGSYYRTQASVLAHSIVDRVRLNFILDPSGTYDEQNAQKAVNDQVLTQYLTLLANPAASVWKKPNCKTTDGCGRIDMARNDIYEWRNSVKAILPRGTVAERLSVINCKTSAGVGCTSPYDTNDSTFIVTISWDENHNGHIDNVDSTGKSCFKSNTLAETAPATLTQKPLQYDPCFRMEFKL